MSAALDLLVLRLTDRCNLRCSYCYAEGGAQGADLPPELALSAVERFCASGEALRVQFTGGEPLLRWDTALKVLAFGAATGRALQASLQTNATLLTPEICGQLKRYRVSVGVSLDGVGEDDGERLRPDGAGSFRETAAGLRTLAEAGMGANLTAVVTARSVSGMARLPDFALWCGNVHGIGLDLLREQGRAAGRGLAPGPEALETGLRALLARHDLLERLGRPVRLKELERLRLMLRTGKRRACYCHAQTGRSLAVAPDGSLWPCSALVGAAGCCLGTLEEGAPPTGPCPGLAPLQACAACPAFGLCGGGCPAGGRAAGPGSNHCLMHRIFCEHALGRSAGPAGDALTPLEDTIHAENQEESE